MGLLKKYRHQKNLTACAIEFMKMVGADHSSPLEGWSMDFVMYASSNHAVVLHNVTPIDLLAQSAILSDGVVVEGLHQPTALRHPITQTVGADLYIRPKVESSYKSTRSAPPNHANHLPSTCTILCVDTTQTQTTRRGGFIYPP